MREKYEPSVFVSAARPLFLNDLKQEIYRFYRQTEQVLRCTIHAADGESLSKIYSMAEVIDRVIEEDKIILRSRASVKNAERLKHFAQEKGFSVETISG